MNVQFPFLFYQNCTNLLFEYDGGAPFHLYLKSRFKENKNWGSKDRKRYRSACYFFWRNAVGVSRQSPDNILTWLQTHYSQERHQSVSTDNYLPYHSLSPHLSHSITPQSLTHWFVNEPVVWISPGKISIKSLQSEFQKANIPIEQQYGNALAVSPQANLNPWLENGKIYIQDISSQMAMDWTTQPMAAFCNANHEVWDCCSGSGGKSISLLKHFPSTQLTCSDVRTQILENLKTRFQLLGLKQPKVFTASANEQNNQSTKATAKPKFHVVLADVPCSGSGTWRRNPENLHFFDPQTIPSYTAKQFQIVESVVPSIAVGGYLVYLTCSLFAEENEFNVKKILESHPNLIKVSEEFCGGIEFQGDFIYRCILQKIN